MKTLVLICILSVLFMSKVKSAVVDTIIAKTVAKNFYAEKLIQKTPYKLKSQIPLNFHVSVVHQECEANTSIPYYYIINVSNEGYMIVSAEDEVVPILAYSFEQHYDKDRDWPPAFVEWIAHCKKQIQMVRNHQLKAATGAHQMWQQYLENSNLKSSMETIGVEPLLTTQWSQGCYYNAFCPPDINGPCSHAYAGCVAVAMAQITHYWEHPSSTSYIPGYTDYGNYIDGKLVENSAYGYISGIEPTVYQWSEMQNILNAENEAVASLLYHCGVSVQMNYSSVGSSAVTSKVGNALSNYFGYKTSTSYLTKNNFTDTDWKNMLKEELTNGRPCLYRGASGSNSNGHAFVCDGFQDDWFHFNWGWGGYADGYFYLDNLVPGALDFSYYQAVTIGIYPNYSLPELVMIDYNLDDGLINGKGDADGVVEPGELINISVDVENRGNGVANNVQAYLATDVTDIDIATSSVHWGNINIGELITNNDFLVGVSSDCGTKDVILDLAIVSEEFSWHYQMEVYVNAEVALGNAEYGNEKIFEIEPNIVDEGASIDVHLQLNDECNSCGFLKVVNINGNEVYFKQGILPEMSVVGLEKGFYVVQVSLPGECTYVQKVLVK